jgi:hypothetical protein
VTRPLYELETLVAAEARQRERMTAHLAEERQVWDEMWSSPYMLKQREQVAIGLVGAAIRVVDRLIAKGRTEPIKRREGLRCFRLQWERERRELRKRGLRLSRLDATDRFLRLGIPPGRTGINRSIVPW